MASAYTIFSLLAILAAVSFGYLVLDKPVRDTIDQRAQDATDSDVGNTWYDRLSEMWALFPLFATIAAILWGYSRTVQNRPGGL